MRLFPVQARERTDANGLQPAPDGGPTGRHVAERAAEPSTRKHKAKADADGGERSHRKGAHRQSQKADGLAAVRKAIELAEADWAVDDLGASASIKAVIASIEALVSPELMLTRALDRGAGAGCVPELVDELNRRLPSYANEARHASLLADDGPPHELVLLGIPQGPPEGVEGPMHPTLRGPTDGAELQALQAARRLFDYQRARLHRRRPIRPDVNSGVMEEQRRLAAERPTDADSRDLPPTVDSDPKAGANTVTARDS